MPRSPSLERWQMKIRDQAALRTALDEEAQRRKKPLENVGVEGTGTLITQDGDDKRTLDQRLADELFGGKETQSLASGDEAAFKKAQQDAFTLR